jgi:hypothetical protein
MERDNKINKSLDELVNEDKKLSKMHTSTKGKVRERDERRPAVTINRGRDRSISGDRRRGKHNNDLS